MLELLSKYLNEPLLNNNSSRPDLMMKAKYYVHIGLIGLGILPNLLVPGVHQMYDLDYDYNDDPDSLE